MDKERRLLFPSWLFKEEEEEAISSCLSPLISMSLIGIFSYLSILLARSLAYSSAYLCSCSFCSSSCIALFAS
jgi:hypothetical protein